MSLADTFNTAMPAIDDLDISQGFETLRNNMVSQHPIVMQELDEHDEEVIEDLDAKICWAGEDPYYCGDPTGALGDLVDRPWYWMFQQVRYAVYFGVAAAPWTIFGGALVGANIGLNILANDFWADGNIFLIVNTAYLCIQYALSVILMLEVDWWLRWMKFIRIGSLMLSWVYLFWYVVAAVVLVVVIDDLDGSNITYTNMYTVMVLSYNLIFHLPVLLVNLVIMIKEASMEGIQFLNEVAGTGLDDYSLATGNIIDFFVDIVNWFNVFWWEEAVEDPELFEEQYE